MEMEKILIVDDDKSACEMLSLVLEKEGYRTLQAYSGADALKQCETTPLDLMILDVMIPDKDGWEVCKEVRKFSDIPIIMLTAKDDMLEKILGLELGADDYITKPFDVKEVLARVKALLRRTKNLKNTAEQDKKIIEYDNLIIDMNRYEMRLAGKVQEAPPKELELLFYLASNPNRVFTRDQLLDDVWGFEYYGDSRTIDVHIKRLRSKLEDASERWKLKTVWGVGYKFELEE
ncbi:MAG: response regulator transcription factor [Oscillospiraceae bacterium]|nr:response regulator transcription factor [Oscillospiraceae bacterium]